MKRYLAAGFAGIAAVAFPAAAKAAEVDCSNPQLQIEMTYCAEKAWEAADGDLNFAYQMARRVMKQIDQNLPDDLKGAADTLRDAQRAWIQFRDNACAAEGFQARGGTMEPQLVYICYERLTRQRTEELRTLAEEN